jgi:hypothetical protein
MPEHYLMCTAGYRVTLDRWKFVEHAAREFEGGGWPEVTRDELASALDRLLEAQLMLILTESDVQTENERRVASSLPELDDGIKYRPGHVDFTERGYLLYRDVIRAIHGEEFLLRGDAGFNLDSDAGRFDLYATSAEECQGLMDAIQRNGDSYTGAESTTFVGRDGPSEIGAWRPNRFILHTAGSHGVLRYVSGAAQHPAAADGATRRR